MGYTVGGKRIPQVPRHQATTQLMWRRFGAHRMTVDEVDGFYFSGQLCTPDLTPCQGQTIAPGGVATLVLVSAVPPMMLKTADNPGGLPREVFDGIRAGSVADRAQLYKDIAAGPFFGFNRPGAQVSQGAIQNWWRQGMMGSTKAHYDGVKAFSETDFTEDLKTINVPTLVMHGEDDQIVPVKNSAEKSAKDTTTSSVAAAPRTSRAKAAAGKGTPAAWPSSRQ